jgi:hypothetical protein
MSKQFTAQDVFLAWKTHVQKEVGKAIYLHKQRLEHLEYLCELYRKYKIDYEDAILMKKDFLEFVVTPEGMKGNGKHKTWKKNANDNYIGALNNFYSDNFESQEVGSDMFKNRNTYGEGEYMPKMNIISDWTKQKFGNNWSESICLEAHKVGSIINNMFQKEVLESEWVKTRKNIPEWAQQYC